MDALRRRDLVGVLGWVLAGAAVLGALDLAAALHEGVATVTETAGVTGTAGLAVVCRRLHRSPPRWLGDVALGCVAGIALSSIARAEEPGEAAFLHVVLVWVGFLSFGFLPVRRAWVHIGWVSGVAALMWVRDGATPQEVVVAAVLLVGTMAGVGTVVARLVAEAQSSANTDVLTGIANRRGVLTELAALADGATIAQETTALLVLDLDGFKQVNDEFGHAAGDELLRETTAAWLAALRQRDEIGRLGGDEFLVILPDTTAEAAAVVARRLRDATPAPVTVSIGHATLAPGGDPATALGQADEQLYVGKRRRVGGAGPSPFP